MGLNVNTELQVILKNLHKLSATKENIKKNVSASQEQLRED